MYCNIPQHWDMARWQQNRATPPFVFHPILRPKSGSPFFQPQSQWPQTTAYPSHQNQTSTTFPQWPSGSAFPHWPSSFAFPTAPAAVPSWGRPAGGTFHSNPTRGPRRIFFYDKNAPHYGFTNFSAHPVHYNNKLYPTSEHLFQSLKFLQHRPDIAERIRTCSDRPSVAFAEARRYQSAVRPDWKNVNIRMMDLVLWQKFTQHAGLRQELLATGDAELIEDSPKDDFWGNGANKQGQNQLGKALERLRDQLQHST